VAETPSLERSTDPVSSAARALALRLEGHLAGHERVRLAVPGGSALHALPAARRALGAGWSRVDLTWVDERCVPEADAESNRGAARRLGVLDDPAPRAVLPLFQDGETPAAAVLRVESALRERFAGALDVLLLGLGEDGHIASLFPSRAAPGPGLVAHVADSPKPPADRVTLTRAILETANASVLFAAGAGKRSALERLLAGDVSLPAHGLRGLHVVTDQETTG
jgi:6-phosphogluconolactonase